MMKDVLGICDLHNSPELGRLTDKRPLGAVTFLGRYGLMDFTLSNFSNSGIDQVAILVKDYLHAILSHVQSGQVWNNNTKTGFQRIVFNEQGKTNPLFNTDISNLINNRPQLESIDSNYVVVAPAHFLASIDFRPIIEQHIKEKARITCVYTKTESAKSEFENCVSLKFNAKSNIIKNTSINTGTSQIADISLDTFVFSKEAFIEIILLQKSVSRLYSISDMVSYVINNKVMKVNAYRFNGAVFPMLCLEDYVRHSLDLLQFENRNKLFLDNWPIYTTTHNTPPSFYGKNAVVKNSFIANGSIIKGHVENSIISRDVVIEEGAYIKNSIIFTRSIIGEDVRLEYVVCDKNAKINQVKKLSGSDVSDPLVIAQGVSV